LGLGPLGHSAEAQSKGRKRACARKYHGKGQSSQSSHNLKQSRQDAAQHSRAQHYAADSDNPPVMQQSAVFHSRVQQIASKSRKMQQITAQRRKTLQVAARCST
jgi:hypothetical protein